MTFDRFACLVGCLMGAAGVLAAAGAGHGAGDTHLAAAAQMLLAHAVGTIALVAACARMPAFPIGIRICVVAMQAGAILFAADMATRAFAARALFPFAAPLGGTTLILAWLLAALAFVALSLGARQPPR